jgi:hypothetical protein
MNPVFAKGDRKAIQKLLAVRREAQQEKAPRLVLRIQGILMSLEGRTGLASKKRVRAKVVSC